MFGKRLVPCFLIGLAVGFFLFLGASLALAVVPAVGVNAPTIGFAIGLLAPTGMGLYADMAESETSKLSATTIEPALTQDDVSALIATALAERDKATASSSQKVA